MNEFDLGDSLLVFAGIILSHDPKTLKLHRRKKLYTNRLLSGDEMEGTLWNEYDMISGTGELFGEEREQDLKKLQAIYRKGSSEALSVPYMGAMRAVLEELTLSAQPLPDVISVSFVFRAAPNEIHPSIFSEPYCTAGRNDRLWDISRRYDVDIEELVRLNPQIRDISSLDEGKVILLRDFES